MRRLLVANNAAAAGVRLTLCCCCWEDEPADASEDGRADPDPADPPPKDDIVCSSHVARNPNSTRLFGKGNEK